MQDFEEDVTSYPLAISAGTLLERDNKKGLPDFLEALESVLVAGACNQRYLQLWSGAA